MKHVQKKAGAGVPSANRITLLRDADGDGVAETRTVFLDRISIRRSAWRSSATTSTSRTPMRCCAFPTRAATTQITARRREGRGPAGGHDQSSLDEERHREPRRLASSTSTVGSNSNVGENGIDEGRGRAAIWEVDRATGRARAFRVGPAQSERHGVAAADRRAVDRRSTSATSSATISCPTT